MASYKEKYNEWCGGAAFDEETKKELLALTDEKEIEDRFYKELEFGTAGLRGVMGAGTNRMNRYTVGKASLGMARYLLENVPDAAGRGIVIGFDTRNNSREFARRAADVFTACGIAVHLFDAPSPIPLLSYTVRRLGCCAGVVLTASHNPPQYNGYKAYDETGCQLGVEASAAVTKKVEEIADYALIPSAGCDALLTVIGKDAVDSFCDTVLSLSVFDDKKAKAALKVVYTPIHGSGNIPVRQVLGADGFSDLHVVPEQEAPDGDFPTVKSPNPEDAGALKMGIELAKKIGAELVFGTDPDADRIGCAVIKNGQETLLTGNQVGALFVDFLLKTKKDRGENPVVIKTVVTGELGAEIAEKNGCEVMQVLTGFRFIGEKINGFVKEKAAGDPAAHSYLIGYEESYGYLPGTHARDKDSVGSALLLCEMAAFYKAQGKTLLDALDDLYTEYGYHLDKVESFTLQGKEGLARIAEMMTELRRDHSFVPDLKECRDYGAGLDGLPKSNVLKFILTDGTWIVARPSGTEPKIKFYYSIIDENRALAAEKLARLQELFHGALKL